MTDEEVKKIEDIIKEVNETPGLDDQQKMALMRTLMTQNGFSMKIQESKVNN